MPWVRFDDQYTIHRKVDGLSDAAFRLHTSAIFWCARNLTDGFVSGEDLDGVTARVRTPARFAAECVSRGAWHEARFDCPSEKCAGPVDGDGWVIHDYLRYQPSKAEVLADREDAAKRQAKWRAGKTGRNAVTRPGMSENDPIHNAGSNGVTNAVNKPSPARPAPKEAGRAVPAPERPAPRASPSGSPAGLDEEQSPALPRRSSTPGGMAAAVTAAREAIAAKRGITP